MPRTRLIVVTLVVGLLAVACGGDTEPADGAAQAGLSADAAATPVADAADGADAPADASPVAVESVRLGARFGWCTDVQGAWDSTAASLSATIGVAAAYHEALLAADTAADDLDRAEATERAASLEQHLDDALGGYFAVIAAASGEPRTAATDLLQVVEGVTTTAGEGTQAVAYQRASGAYTAAAGEADMMLLAEFEDLHLSWRVADDDRVRQLGLPLPAVVHATLNVRGLVDPPRLEDVEGANYAGVVVEAVTDTGYGQAVGDAADFVHGIPQYADRLPIDIRPAADAYKAEAALYETVVAGAVDAALAAVTGVYNSAAVDGSFDSSAQQAVAAQATEAARLAASAVFENALQHLDEVRDEAVRARNGALAAVPTDDRDYIDSWISFQREGAPAAGGSSARQVRDAAEDASWALREAQEEAAEAAREALPGALHEAVTETAAAARAAGLASVVVAELMLYQLETGMFDLGDMYVRPSFTPSGLLSFFTSAVAVETLITGQAWRALQQSLADDCQ